MQRKLCLIAVAVSLLTSVGCSTIPTARPFHQPPGACLAACEIPHKAPRTNDQAARNEWEHETLRRFGACVDLHAECTKESLKRMGAPRDAGR